jgi:uncharacterized protein (TIGR02453 family)
MANMTFQGYSPAALDFLRKLARNNRRPWFQARKEIYEQEIKAPTVELVTAINHQLMDFAPNYISAPKKAIFRIYRDTRFSHDKTPYKTRVAVVFHVQGAQSKTSGAFYYFHFNAKEMLIWGGVYMPPADELRAFRALLAERYHDFRKIARAKPLRTLMGELQMDQLSRVPKGYAKDHPAEDLLRGKTWGFEALLPAKIVTTPKLVPEIVKRFRVMVPFLEFMNQPVTKHTHKPKRMPFGIF